MSSFREHELELMGLNLFENNFNLNYYQIGDQASDRGAQYGLTFFFVDLISTKNGDINVTNITKIQRNK